MLLGIPVFLNARQIEFRPLSLQEALHVAAKENKPVFFMGFASWCSHCEHMFDKVFTDSSVAAYYNTHFVCIDQDIEKGDGPQLAEKFNISVFPTFVFMDSTGEVLYQITGEYQPASFIEQGENSFITEMQLPWLRKRYFDDPGDSVKCLSYLAALNRGRIDALPVAVAWLQANWSNFPFNTTSWHIFNTGISDIASEPFAFIVAHRDDFAAAVTQEKVDRKLYYTAAYSLKKAEDVNDTATYFTKRPIAASLGLRSVDSLLFNLDMNLYERNREWDRYAATALEGTRKYAWDSYDDLRHIAQIFQKTVQDTASLREAAEWAMRSSELRPEYANTVLCAQLLYACGDKPHAKEEAEKAQEIARKTLSPSAEADLIIKECR